MPTQSTLLTDAQWAALSPILPAEPTDAQPPNRQFIDGILWLSEGGHVWDSWPVELGDYKKAYKRAAEWGLQGIWGEVAALLPGTNRGIQALRAADEDYRSRDEDFPFLTEAQWTVITPLLPAEPQDSQPTNRQFVDEVLWLQFVGATWASWPTELGDSAQAILRAQEWVKQGIWGKIAETLTPATTLRRKLNAFQKSITEDDLIDAELLGQLRPTTRAAAANSTFRGTGQPTQEDSQYQQGEP
jgi:transposase